MVAWRLGWPAGRGWDFGWNGLTGSDWFVVHLHCIHGFSCVCIHSFSNFKWWSSDGLQYSALVIRCCTCHIVKKANKGGWGRGWWISWNMFFRVDAPTLGIGFFPPAVVHHLWILIQSGGWQWLTSCDDRECPHQWLLFRRRSREDRSTYQWELWVPNGSLDGWVLFLQGEWSAFDTSCCLDPRKSQCRRHCGHFGQEPGWSFAASEALSMAT